MLYILLLLFFFFNDTATTEIYTLSLHDALPISKLAKYKGEDIEISNEAEAQKVVAAVEPARWQVASVAQRSEEHTSELQSPCNLVCRLLLEKKKPKPLLKRLPPLPATERLSYHL